MLNWNKTKMITDCVMKRNKKFSDYIIFKKNKCIVGIKQLIFPDIWQHHKNIDKIIFDLSYDCLWNENSIPTVIYTQLSLKSYVTKQCI